MGERCPVYVAILDEGTAVWRPVAAERVSGDVFRLTGPVPEGEQWEFQPGELVRCDMRAFSGGERALAAVALADAEPGAAPDRGLIG
jgi:hypothetical protein